MKVIKHLIWTVISIVAITGIAIISDGLTDNIQKADLIVILGNKVEESGTPSARLQSRLDKGIELYNQGHASHVLVSGGIGTEGFDEAEVMKRYLVENGVASENIITDNKGIDSYNSARNAKETLDEEELDSVIIVTNYYHISRTRLAFKKSGAEPVYSAHADYFEIRDIYSIAREVVGYYYYILRKY